MGLLPGLVSYVQIAVGDADTMTAMGTGDVPVLAIPRMLELADEAAVAAIAPSLEPGVTSVSTSVAIEHRRPSPIGAEVVVWSELTEVDGQRLRFSFIARQKQPSGSLHDEDPVVAAGTLERVLVDRDRFARCLRVG